MATRPSPRAGAEVLLADPPLGMRRWLTEHYATGIDRLGLAPTECVQVSKTTSAMHPLLVLVPVLLLLLLRVLLVLLLLLAAAAALLHRSPPAATVAVAENTDTNVERNTCHRFRTARTLVISHHSRWRAMWCMSQRVGCTLR